MNYRHAFHAGNFADVFKHAILVRVVDYLKRKEQPFRVIDTHAGIGLYDLSSAQAQKTGEWHAGIGRVLEKGLPEQAQALVQPYLNIVTSFNGPADFRYYPGSPAIVRALLRARDRMTPIELHPEDHFALKARFAGDWQVRVIELDGWLALGAQVPPKEKRGLVLVDPPFEETGEFDRMLEGLERAWKRWPGGTYAFWYPIKDHRAVEAFRARLAGLPIPKILDASLLIRSPSAEPRLDGCGMALVNPPYTLKAELETILPALAAVLGEGAGAKWRVAALTADALAT